MGTRIKSENITITPENPWENDKLGREKEIRSLTKIIRNVEPPVVMSINSSWGKGKTTFIRLWENHLSAEKKGKNGIESVYFNAWETDFSEDPLVAFLGEINFKLSKIIDDDSALREKWRKTKAIGIEIAKKAAPSVISIATSGFVRFDNDAFDKAASKIAEKLSSEALEEYIRKKSEISLFKKNIEEIIQESNCGRLVVFVDELDRCRPNYSIELLERIKHLFNVDGIIFVLSVAKEQLCSSIRQIYGAEIDAAEYLRKFIDIEYQLSEPPREAFIDGLMEYFGITDFISDCHWGEESKQREIVFLRDVVLSVSNHSNASLRDINQLLGIINIAVRAAGNNGPYPYCFLGFMCLIKEWNAGVYSRICSIGIGRDERLYLSNCCKKTSGDLGLGHVIEAQFHAISHKEESSPERIREAYDAVNAGYQITSPSRSAYERSLIEGYKNYRADFLDVNFTDLIGLVDFSSHFD